MLVWNGNLDFGNSGEFNGGVFAKGIVEGGGGTITAANTAFGGGGGSSTDEHTLYGIAVSSGMPGTVAQLNADVIASDMAPPAAIPLIGSIAPIRVVRWDEVSSVD